MQAQAGIQELEALGSPAGMVETGPCGVNQRTTHFCTLGGNLWHPLEVIQADRQ